MESISALDGLRLMKEVGMKFVSPTEAAKLFGIRNKNSTYKMLLRWEKYGMVERLAPGIYRLTDLDVGNFEIANKLVEPSYISLETALNFYGVLPQFPYTVTSVTTRKARKIATGGKEYEYTKLANSLYWGYEKTNDGLIASVEKAIVDQLYLAAKGLRSAHVEEWDMDRIDRSRLADYCREVKFAPFVKLVKRTGIKI